MSTIVTVITHEGIVARVLDLSCGNHNQIGWCFECDCCKRSGPCSACTLWLYVMKGEAWVAPE